MTRAIELKSSNAATSSGSEPNVSIVQNHGGTTTTSNGPSP
jgi:hypothetical protein